MKLLTVSKWHIGILVNSKPLTTHDKITDTGFTAYVCIGRWAGIGINLSEFPTVRIVLGCISIGLMFYDYEMRLKRIIQAFERMKLKLENKQQ